MVAVGLTVLGALTVELVRRLTQPTLGNSQPVGGVDSVTGSVFWQVDLGGMEVDSLSRRQVAAMCRELGARRHLPLLPRAVQLRIANFPQHSYGIKRVVVTLDDGTEHRGVYVAWCKEIALVRGCESIPFDADRIVDVRHDLSEGEDAAS